ncbi:MAG: hypothetical protein MI746_16920 [Pseudomonadales bacterium]|nr:hypothetical protein [Pseudomonadales bacterium]
MQRKTLVKILIGLALFYLGLVVLFESSLGYFQPEAGNTVAITTFDADGEAHRRIVSLLSSNEQLYVAVNHWPRAWYRRLRENPSMRMEQNGVDSDYTAVIVEGAEHDRVQADNPTGIVFRILTGFPPRYFVRLDPR